MSVVEPGFTMRTSDVSSLRSLMHAARDLVQDISISFSEEGLQISEQACQRNLFMFAMFRANRFEYFKATGRGQVCFCPKYMYDMLVNRQQRDVLEWSFGPDAIDTLGKKDLDTLDKKAKEEYKNDKKQCKRGNHMLMRILQDGEELTVWKIWVPLVHRTQEIYESPTTDVDYVLLFDTAQISNIISGFKEFEKDFRENWLRITCTPHQVQFEMEQGCIVGRMRWTLKTFRPSVASTDETQADPNASPISHEYRLAYLQNIIKCFSINRGSGFMYVKRGFPLVIEVKVGTLGELRLALMFRADEYDSEDDYASDTQQQGHEEEAPAGAPGVQV